jgi:acetyltransferase-like isoleucine patch superfamily enzyme
MHQELEFKLVRIGKGCDIGANAVILPGVTLGDYCQVGAGAVVTKSFPAHSIVTGVPASLQGKFE